MGDTATDDGPRIAPLDADAAHAAATATGISRGMADLAIFRVLLRQPELARTLHDLLMALLAGEHLDARLRELVIMRLGWATGSVYEWTQHWRIARLVGLEDDRLLAVREWRAHGGFSPAERAVLAATDETLAAGRVTDATWRACELALPSPEARLELVAAIGLWQMVATVLETLRVPLEDGVEPWPPDGATPR